MSSQRDGRQGQAQTASRHVHTTGCPAEALSIPTHLPVPQLLALRVWAGRGRQALRRRSPCPAGSAAAGVVRGSESRQGGDVHRLAQPEVCDQQGGGGWCPSGRSTLKGGVVGSASPVRL